MQIRIDGLRQNDPFAGAAALNLPASVIDFIDVYYGPGGTWFGEGSLLGVIAVTTKRSPEQKLFGHFALDKSLGGGFVTAVKHNRFRAGSYAAFSLQDPTLALHANPQLLSSATTSFPLQDLTASGFFKLKLSNAAQAFLTARSTVTQEFFGPGPDYGFGQLKQDKLLWNSEIHVLKKRAQKNAFDLFFAVGVFHDNSRLRPHREQNALSVNELQSVSKSLRAELGIKFHFQPFHGHDLFFGLGTSVQGAYDAHQQMGDDDRVPMQFAKAATIFGSPTDKFAALNGHIYGFAQDEWQFRGRCF